MRTAPSLLTLSVAASLVLAASNALAFGGTAREFERQGNFVITNNAGFAFNDQLNGGTPSHFTLRPALDYFVIDHLSVGAAVQLDFDSPSQPPKGPRPPNTTLFSVAPDVGYEFALSDTWSFWPQASLTVNFPNQGDATATLVLYAPFLIHPAEHFFFGLGPGFSQDLTANANTLIIGRFTIGGYFDH